MPTENEEERDVPPLPALAADIQSTIERLRKMSFETPQQVASVLINDLLPLMKDMVESTWYGFEDVQDEINPIRLTGSEAQEVKTLLLAAKQGAVGNALLTARIDSALEPFDVLDEDEDEDESDGEETEN